MASSPLPDNAMEPCPRQSRILVVDDDMASREALAEVLRENRYNVRTAADGNSALACIQVFSPDLIITDLAMPHLGGFGLVQCIRGGVRAREVPVVVISSCNDPHTRARSFEFGADDFLAKPVDIDELFAHVERHLLRSSVQKEAERLSVSDELTGMLNRRGLRNFFARTQSEALRLHTISVLLVDVDNFKAINDRYGHAVGDLALSAAARTLQNALRTSDRVGRIGGDEFVAILPDADKAACARLETRLRACLPIWLNLTDRDRIAISFSIGSATAHGDETLDALVERADQAMYENKRASAVVRRGTSSPAN